VDLSLDSDFTLLATAMAHIIFQRQKQERCRCERGVTCVRACHSQTSHHRELTAPRDAVCRTLHRVRPSAVAWSLHCTCPCTSLPHANFVVKTDRASLLSANQKCVSSAMWVDPLRPVIPSEGATQIVARLAEAAAATPDRQRQRAKRRRVEDRDDSAAHEGSAVSVSSAPADESAAIAGEHEIPPGAIPRRDLAVGVNEVTRGLEAGAIALVRMTTHNSQRITSYNRCSLCPRCSLC